MHKKGKFGVKMRLIDVDKLKEALDTYNKEIHTPNAYLQKLQEAIIEDIKDVIDEQPLQNQWIPCSIRLPNTEEVVLATCDWGFYKQVITNWINTCDSEWYVSNEDTTAWMPLPNPYESEDKYESI